MIKTVISVPMHSILLWYKIKNPGSYNNYGFVGNLFEVNVISLKYDS